MGYKSPVCVSYPAGFSSSNPAANTTYYGNCLGNALTTSLNFRLLYMVRNGRIRAFDLHCQAGNTPTTEDITVYLRTAATDYLIGTFNHNGANGELHIYNHDLNIPVVKNNSVQMKIVMAAVFVTPPTSWGGAGSYYTEIE